MFSCCLSHECSLKEFALCFNTVLSSSVVLRWIGQGFLQTFSGLDGLEGTMVHGVFRLQGLVLELRLDNGLGGDLSCDFSVFGLSHLVSVEVVRSFPTKGEGSFFVGWIR